MVHFCCVINVHQQTVRNMIDTKTRVQEVQGEFKDSKKYRNLYISRKKGKHEKPNKKANKNIKQNMFKTGWVVCKLKDGTG